MTLESTHALSADMLATIIGRAWKDADFKQALLADPTAALATHLGLLLAPEGRLTVLEETAAALYLVLPAADQPAAGPAEAPAEARIRARAQADPAFRAALCANPRPILEQEFGFALPAAIAITVLEETPEQRYLILPVDPLLCVSERELADIELALVAGGGRTYRPGGGPDKPGGASPIGRPARLQRRSC